MKPIIEIKNLNAGYDGRTVLRDVNLTVYDRDFLGIIGPNGGGKTTLIKCILGLLKPLSGEISFTSSRTAGNFQLTMGYLPQYLSLIHISLLPKNSRKCGAKSFSGTYMPP